MRPPLILLLASVLALTACDQDGRILWAEGSGGNSTGGGTGAGAGTSSGTEPGTTFDPAMLGLLDRPWLPWPPPPLECFGPEPPICYCPAATSCACAGPPEPPLDPCQLVCEGTDCNLICHPDNVCDMTCDAGCTMVCEPFSTCNLSCDSDCQVLCQEGSFCTVWSAQGPIELFCDLTAICECPVPGSCICNGPGCPPP